MRLTWHMNGVGHPPGAAHRPWPRFGLWPTPRRPARLSSPTTPRCGASPPGDLAVDSVGVSASWREGWNPDWLQVSAGYASHLLESIAIAEMEAASVSIACQEPVKRCTLLHAARGSNDLWQKLTRLKSDAPCAMTFPIYVPRHQFRHGTCVVGIAIHVRSHV